MINDLEKILMELEIPNEKKERLDKILAGCKKLEASLRESKRRDCVISDLSLGFKGLLSPDGILLQANQLSLDFIGVKIEDVAGKLFWETPWWSHSPETKGLIKKLVGEAAQGKICREEVIHTAKDGQLHYIDFSLKPFFDGNGFVELLIPEGYDITRRKRMEKSLRESEEKYRLLFENAVEGIFQTTPDGKLVSANPALAKIFGYETADEFMDGTYRTNQQYADPDDRKKFKTILEKEGMVKDFEVQFFNKRRELIWVSISAKIQTNDAGDIIGYNGTVKDITKQKEAEEKNQKLQEQITHADKMEAIGTLAGGIAHDFNNLLMVIQGCVSIITMNTEQASSHHRHLKMIEEKVISGSELTRQLLGFARRGRYDVKSININTTIREISLMFSRTKKEITLDSKYENDIWRVEADRGQMEQIFLNLFVNAGQAISASSGKIRLETENVIFGKDEGIFQDIIPAGRYVKIVIADNGIGMTRKILERIFEPFFTTKEFGRGTGLGLAMVYGIVKGHHGFIDVWSNPGQGTRFSIYLPASKEQPECVIEKDAPEKISKGTESILLVDDEATVLEVNKTLIEYLGYEAFTASNGEEAIVALTKQAEKIKLVILDMIMPGLSGEDTFSCLRNIKPDIKVLLCSGYNIDGDAERIIARGCNGFIQKPFGLKQISQKIREVLEKN